MPSKAPKKIVNLRFLIVIIFFALFAGNAFAQACVDMPALLGYIGDWKTGSMDMPTLLGYIGDWKAGTGCGTTTMTTASRTSGVMPLGVFFDAVDNASLVVASSVVQPKGLAAQPVQITGVKITTVSFSNALGNGTLSFNAAAKTLSWNSGTTTNVSAGGNFVLPSSSGAKLYVWVDPAQLPSSNVSEQITIENGGVNADWAAFNYEWDFGDPAPSGTSSTDPLWFWEQGAKKSDGSWFEKNKAFGWNAAHVYENEGTYQVKLKIIDDEGGIHEYTQTINVTAEPTGGWTTYYFAASGNDLTGDGSQVSPFQSLEKAKSLAGDNVKLLFNRGNDFQVVSSWSPRASGAFYVGAYGIGNRPRFVVNTGGFVNGSNLQDARFVDLWIDGGYPTVADPGSGFIYLGNNTLLLRTRVQDMTAAYDVMGRQNNVLQDCEAANIGRYDVWISDNPRTAVLGCVGTTSANNTEAPLRTYSEHLIVAHNTFTPFADKSVFRFHGNTSGLIHSHVIVAYNDLTGVQVNVAGESASTAAVLRHIVIEGNQINITPMPRGSDNYGSDYLTLRNNRYTTSSDATIINFTAGYNGGPYSHSITKIINNSAYTSNTTYIKLVSGAGLVGANALVVKNNAISGPLLTDAGNTKIYNLASHLASDPLLQSGNNNYYLPKLTTPYRDSASSNYTLAQWQAKGQDAGTTAADPMFTNPATGNLLLRTGSPGINTGDATMLPWNRIDADGKPRGLQPDIGAFEYP
ncbi:MAG TPA: choice-of-anchor Q domain-containing protein [archaeon]|nr:choice-of-anchor Q domain-containing protein [archaeon]